MSPVVRHGRGGCIPRCAPRSTSMPMALHSPFVITSGNLSSATTIAIADIASATTAAVLLECRELNVLPYRAKAVTFVVDSGECDVCD